MHEGCRFKEKCTKQNCPYVHPFKSKSIYHIENNNVFETLIKTYLAGQNQPFKSKKKAPRPPNQTGQAPTNNVQEMN